MGVIVCIDFWHSFVTESHESLAKRNSSMAQFSDFRHGITNRLGGLNSSGGSKLCFRCLLLHLALARSAKLLFPQWWSLFGLFCGPRFGCQQISGFIHWRWVPYLHELLELQRGSCFKHRLHRLKLNHQLVFLINMRWEAFANRKLVEYLHMGVSKK